MTDSSQLDAVISSARATLSGERRAFADSEEFAPDAPGLYAVYGETDTWLQLGLGAPSDDRPLYVGKAEDSLRSRDLRTHFGDGRTGSSTVRRSFAALLRERLDLRAQPRNPAKPERFANYGLADGAVRELALGAQRLRDLQGPTLKAFIGTDSTDLGPKGVNGLLEEARDRHVRDVARELALILVRRAQRVALSKMYLTRDGRPFAPTRLRDRDGILSVRGEEGAGDVALRMDPLADVLACSTSATTARSSRASAARRCVAAPKARSPYALLDEVERARDVLGLTYTDSLEFCERFALAEAPCETAAGTKQACGIHNCPLTSSSQMGYILRRNRRS